MNTPVPSRTEMPLSFLGSARTRSPPCDTGFLPPDWYDRRPEPPRRQADPAFEDRHTRVEWLRFLESIDELTIHVVADDYATHKHARVRAWLARRPRFETRFSPTSGSRLNLVERFFADLTAAIRARGFASVATLPRGIARHLGAHNDDPRPCRWTAEAEDVLAKTKCAGHGWRRFWTQSLIQPISSAGH